MAWIKLPDGTLYYTGAGPVPMLSPAEQQALRSSLPVSQPPGGTTSGGGGGTGLPPGFTSVVPQDVRLPPGHYQGYIVDPTTGQPVFGVVNPNTGMQFQAAGSALSPAQRKAIIAELGAPKEESGGGGGGVGAPPPLSAPKPATPQVLPGPGGGGGGGGTGASPLGPQNQSLDWLLSALAAPGLFPPWMFGLLPGTQGGQAGGPKGGGAAVPPQAGDEALAAQMRAQVSPMPEMAPFSFFPSSGAEMPAMGTAVSGASPSSASVLPSSGTTGPGQGLPGLPDFPNLMQGLPGLPGSGRQGQSGKK